MLSPADRDLIHRFFTEGASAFQDTGMTHDEFAAFLLTPDAKAECVRFLKDYRNQETLMALSKFATQRQLVRLLPGAVGVLAQTLAGPIYDRDENGNIIRDQKGLPVMRQAGPTALQVKAATEVLDRTGVMVDQHVDKSVKDANLDALVSDPGEVDVKIDYEGMQTEEERVLSRERMRSAMEKLMGVVGDGHQAVQQRLGLGNKKKKTNGQAKPKKGKPKKAKNRSA